MRLPAALLGSTLLAAALALPAAADPLAPKGLGAPPPAPPAQPVTETLFGKAVTDNYRFMEALSPETLGWMRSEGAYARRVLEAIAPLKAVQARVSALSGSIGAVSSYADYGGRTFYEERRPGADAPDLYVRDAAGVRKLVDVEAVRRAHGGKPIAINWSLPAPDGSKVAVGISEGGSEDAVMTVLDAATGAEIGAPVSRAQFGATAWAPDSSGVYFIRLNELKPGDAPIKRYLNAKASFYDLAHEPQPVAGAGVSAHATFGPGEAPAILIPHGSPLAFLVAIDGVRNEKRVWYAPVAAARAPDAPWTSLADHADAVTDAAAVGEDIYLLTHKDAPTFKVIHVRAGQPLSAADTVVPADPARVIEGVSAAADGLYVTARRGAYSELLRVRPGAAAPEPVALPGRGHIGELFTDPAAPGAVFAFSSWTLPPRFYRLDPRTAAASDLRLGAPGDFDPAGFAVQDLEARARDGVAVPLTLVRPKGASGHGPTVVEAYGSYGISELADFSTRRAAMMREGINYGICHVRGGGELGEAWRLGGKDANKPNTWRDLIACGEDLIARGVATRAELFIIGGSAGGITMGRAMEERPDLFAGVIDIVPAADTLRSEFTPNGPPNIPEFGTVKTEAGFRNLYEMDSYIHVRPGVAYPPVLISTGLNDPRVSPWEPAKFAAALLAAKSPNPVLLRIDEEAGHGIGSTRTQSDLLTADWIGFVFWRSGRPGWRPAAR